MIEDDTQVSNFFVWPSHCQSTSSNSALIGQKQASQSLTLHCIGMPQGAIFNRMTKLQHQKHQVAQTVWTRCASVDLATHKHTHLHKHMHRHTKDHIQTWYWSVGVATTHKHVQDHMKSCCESLEPAETDANSLCVMGTKDENRL